MDRLIEWLHGKRTFYVACGLAIVGLEGWFAYRSSLVVYLILNHISDGITAFIAAIIMFFSIGMAGAAVSMHIRRQGFWALMIIVIAADWGGVLYLFFGTGGNIYDPITWTVDIVWCLLSLAPIAFGIGMNSLHTELEAERESEHIKNAARAKRQLEKLAMKRFRREAKGLIEVIPIAALLPETLAEYAKKIDEFTKQPVTVKPNEPLALPAPEEATPNEPLALPAPEEATPDTPEPGQRSEPVKPRNIVDITKRTGRGRPPGSRNKTVAKPTVKRRQ